MKTKTKNDYKEDEYEGLLTPPPGGGGDDTRDNFVDNIPSERKKAVCSGWRGYVLFGMYHALLLSPLLFFLGSNQENQALVRGAGNPADQIHSLEQLRLDIAKVSIEMMQENTVEAAKRSKMIDIGPFYDLIDAGLDKFGVRGVYTGIFDLHKFADALRAAAKVKGIKDFEVALREKPGKQPWIEYVIVPNDRKYYYSDADNDHAGGGDWWLGHYVGAITADKLLREGSLLLGGSDDSTERVHDAPAFMHELQRLERLENSDIMVFHAQHGFTWHYLAKKMPAMDSYPLDVAEAFCGDLLWKDEWIAHVNDDMGRECRHGFGHGVFYVLAVREAVGFEAYSVRQQFRPVSGFLLSEESLCQAYKICKGAPNEKTAEECKGGMRHSYILIGEGDKFADGSSVSDFLLDQEKECNAMQQANTINAPSSLDPLDAVQGSILGSNEVLYAAHKPSFIFSSNGRFRFGLDSDGDLCLWNEDMKVWSADLAGKGSESYVTMQSSDGNLVVYSQGDATGEETIALWSSGVEGHPGAVLRVDDDGQARIYAADDDSSNVLWEIPTKAVGNDKSSHVGIKANALITQHKDDTPRSGFNKQLEPDAPAFDLKDFHQEPGISGVLGPNVAWLMSFPNSGTSYTLQLAESVSARTMATNYPRSSDNFYAIYKSSPNGPFARQGKKELPDTYILTKTHCGGYCTYCDPEHYIVTEESMYEMCLTTHVYTEREGKFIKISHHAKYNAKLVKRAIHLIRDPLNNIVARFHHQQKHGNKTTFPDSMEGFRSYCMDMDLIYKKQEAESNLIPDDIKALFNLVPCHAEFLKFAQWHSLAFSVSRRMGLATHVMYYENYEVAFEDALTELLSFLELPRVGAAREFIAGKTYHDYFTKEERTAAMKLVRKVASPEAWLLLERYNIL